MLRATPAKWQRLSGKWRASCHQFSTRKSSSATPSPTSEIQIDIPSRPPLNLSFGQLARFADGSCVATAGSTSVLVTAVSANSPNTASQSFVPLTVDYRQKAAAAGRIPTNFLRRELGPTEREILTGRVIDRSLRPLFPKGYGCETQVVANLLAIDGVHDPDVVALNAASAALSLSDIPWNGPVGAVRMGCLNKSELVVNPTRKERSESSLNMVVTGTTDQLMVMLEADAANLDKALFRDGIGKGLEACQIIATAIQQEAALRGRPKRTLNPSSSSETEIHDIQRDMSLLCEQPLRAVASDTTHDKTSRDRATFAVRDTAIQQLKSTYPNANPALFYEAFTKLSRKMIADFALDQGYRVDGRGKDDLRQIGCAVDLHEPLHGSALFQRGQTQVLCTVALDSLESALKSDAISVLTGGVKEKNFFLHYEFPPYATNEIGRTGGLAAGRRELGHGALAEKALRPIIPSDHPFTIRLTSEVLESNGSSSMASVCGGSMALMDAGVPIETPAAGVAVGLVTRGHDNNSGSGFDEHAVLVDILGMEDFLGDMDFKMAGTRTGITAVQADIKIPGLPLHVVHEALDKGHLGLNKILDIMEECISEPKANKTNWPLNEKLEIPLPKRARFLGPGGVNVKRLMAETGVQINPDPSDLNAWTVFAPNSDAMAEAREIIDKILATDRVPEFEFGAVYPAKITEILDRGIRVQLHPELQPALIPNSQLDAKKVMHPSVLNLEEGQELLVKYYGRDPVSGALRLSRKALTVGAASVTGMAKKLRTTRSTDPDPEPEPESPSPVTFRNGRSICLASIFEDDDEKVKEKQAVNSFGSEVNLKVDTRDINVKETVAQDIVRKPEPVVMSAQVEEVPSNNTIRGRVKRKLLGWKKMADVKLQSYTDSAVKMTAVPASDKVAENLVGVEDETAVAKKFENWAEEEYSVKATVQNENGQFQTMMSQLIEPSPKEDQKAVLVVEGVAPPPVPDVADKVPEAYNQRQTADMSALLESTQKCIQDYFTSVLNEINENEETLQLVPRNTLTYKDLKRQSTKSNGHLAAIWRHCSRFNSRIHSLRSMNNTIVMISKGETPASFIANNRAIDSIAEKVDSFLRDFVLTDTRNRDDSFRERKKALVEEIYQDFDRALLQIHSDLGLGKIKTVTELTRPSKHLVDNEKSYSMSNLLKGTEEAVQKHVDSKLGELKKINELLNVSNSLDSWTVKDLKKEAKTIGDQVESVWRQCFRLDRKIKSLQIVSAHITRLYPELGDDDPVYSANKEAINELVNKVDSFIQDFVIGDGPTSNGQHKSASFKDIQEEYDQVLAQVHSFELNKIQSEPLLDWIEDKLKLSQVMASDDIKPQVEEYIKVMLENNVESRKLKDLEIDLFIASMNFKDDIFGIRGYVGLSSFREMAQFYRLLSSEHKALQNDWQGNHRQKLDNISVKMDDIYETLRYRKNVAKYFRCFLRRSKRLSRILMPADILYSDANDDDIARWFRFKRESVHPPPLSFNIGHDMPNNYCQGESGPFDLKHFRTLSGVFAHNHRLLEKNHAENLAIVKSLLDKLPDEVFQKIYDRVH